MYVRYVRDHTRCPHYSGCSYFRRVRKAGLNCTYYMLYMYVGLYPTCFFYMVHLLHCTPLGNDGLSAEVSRLANLIGKLESKVSLHVMPSDHLL